MENPGNQRSTKGKQAKWLGDYVFWRDIITTAIGGALVLVIAFWWAVLLGYLNNPGFWEAVGAFVVAVGGTVGPILIVLGLVMLVYFLRAKRKAIKKLEAMDSQRSGA